MGVTMIFARRHQGKTAAIIRELRDGDAVIVPDKKREKLFLNRLRAERGDDAPPVNVYTWNTFVTSARLVVRGRVFIDDFDTIIASMFHGIEASDVFLLTATDGAVKTARLRQQPEGGEENG